MITTMMHALLRDDQSKIQNELKQKGIKIAKELSTTDYANKKFVFENTEDRWIRTGKNETD